MYLLAIRKKKQSTS